MASEALELLRCLRALTKVNWITVFEALSKTDRILRRDPAGAFARMDAESRSRYHGAVAELAARSSWSEAEVAREALRLARGPHVGADPRATERRSHIGYYLIDAGRNIIKGDDWVPKSRSPSAFAARCAGGPHSSYLSTIILATCWNIRGIAGGVGGLGANGSAVRHLALDCLDSSDGMRRGYHQFAGHAFP